MFRRCSWFLSIALISLLSFGVTAAHGQKDKKKPPPPPPPPPTIEAAITYTLSGTSRYRVNVGEICVASSDASQSMKILGFKTGTGAANPCFSPDGKKIAFVARFSSNKPTQLCTINVDGSDLRVLADLNQIYYWMIRPDWSPDGTRIAFIDKTPTNGTYDVFTIHPDGSGLTNLTNTPEWHEYGPSWSPTGNRILISRESNSVLPNLVVLQLNNQGQIASVQDITNIDGSPLRDRVDWGSRSCAWARDSERVAVTIVDVWWGDRTDIWLIDLANPLTPVNLTNTPDSPNEVNPAFDDVDQRIFFNVEGWRGIWVMNVDGSNRVRFLTDAEDTLWGPSYRR